MSQDRNGNPVQSIDYKPSGVIFTFSPIIRDETVDVTVSQELSSFIPTTTGVASSPTLIKRSINTSIGAGFDDVVMLGGLDEDKSTVNHAGLSFLPGFMKSNTGDESQNQILLVMQVQKI